MPRRPALRPLRFAASASRLALYYHLMYNFLFGAAERLPRWLGRLEINHSEDRDRGRPWLARDLGWVHGSSCSSPTPRAPGKAQS